jgi:hypothetical protein
MRPPECAVCGADVDPRGGLVVFQMDPAAEKWHVRAAEPGFVGHPPNEDWFCGDHREAAEALTERPLGEALAALRR